MQAKSDFPAISPDETENLSMDFSADLATGDSIVSVQAVNLTIASKSLGTDSAPASHLSGAPTVNGSLVTQTVSGCVADVIYVLEMVINTSGGEVLSLWAFLPCVAPGL